MIKDLHTLPSGLPVPVDDGACDHLPGRRLPSVSLASTGDGPVTLSTLAGTVVVYFFPMLGRPDRPPLIGWNDIPGARGCTPQSCAFRDEYRALKAQDAEVFGVSAQPLADQQEAHGRLHLPFALLHDGAFALTRALNLPTFEYAGQKLIKRLSIIAVDGVIQKVFYPVFPPDGNAAAVIAWLVAQDATRGL